MFLKVDYGGSCNWIECDYVHVGSEGGVCEKGKVSSVKIIIAYDVKDDVALKEYRIDLTRHDQPGVYLLNDNGDTVEVIHKEQHSYTGNGSACVG